MKTNGELFKEYVVDIQVRYFGSAARHPWEFWGLVGGITTIAVLGLFSIILD